MSGSPDKCVNEQVTRGHKIFADGRAGAYIHTLAHPTRNGSIKNAGFRTFQLDQQGRTDKASFGNIIIYS